VKREMKQRGGGNARKGKVMKHAAGFK